MALVLQIVVLLVVLIGLITTIMSIKNWHWAQMLLLLGIFFVSITVLLLGLEVFRIHRNIRKVMPTRERQLAEVEAENEALAHGTRDAAIAGRIFQAEIFGGQAPYNEELEGRMPGMGVWTQRVQDLSRQRGRVWRGVQPAGKVDPATGRVQVVIAAPKPSGLANDAIVYAFEQGPPNPAAPDQGAQYLGEFRVVEVGDDGAVLESLQRLDPRTGTRLEKSFDTKKLWSLYQTIPADSHELFAGLTEEELKQLIPAASVTDYLRQGTPATNDDDDYHRAGFDEQKQRVGPEDAAKAVEWRYDRPLRDYGYLFSELIRERVVMLADGAAIKEDVAKLKGALESANKLKAHRTAEIAALEKDRDFMIRDRDFITKLLATIQQQVANGKQQVADLLRVNESLAQELINKQLARLEEIDRTSPAPAGSPVLLNSAP